MDQNNARPIIDLSLVADLAAKAGLVETKTFKAFEGGREGPATVDLVWDNKQNRLLSIRPLIEENRLRPALRKGTASVETLRSFIALTNRHKSDDSAIFAVTKYPNLSLMAVIDYHTLDHKPDNGAHRIRYDFPITDELQNWCSADGQKMDQLAFAAFLEEHAAELATATQEECAAFEPLFKERFASPAELLRLSRDLEIHVSSRVKRAERLQSGERTVEFVEEHATGGGEKVDIPGLFMICVQAFVDGAPVRMPARLRYRLAGGSIVWFFQIYRWQFWLQSRVRADVEQAAQETGLPFFEGTPEK